MGIGDWGLAQSPIPNPQSPIPINFLIKILIKQIYLFLICIFILISKYFFNWCILRKEFLIVDMQFKFPIQIIKIYFEI